MITVARVDADLTPARMQWITALHYGTNSNLVLKSVVTPDRFEPWQMGRGRSPDLPGERQNVCFDPPLTEERRPKRDARLLAPEDAAAIRQHATRREPSTTTS